MLLGTLVPGLEPGGVESKPRNLRLWKEAIVLPQASRSSKGLWQVCTSVCDGLAWGPGTAWASWVHPGTFLAWHLGPGQYTEVSFFPVGESQRLLLLLVLVPTH